MTTIDSLKSMNRRLFLRAAAVGAGASLIASPSLAARSANGMLNVAVVGCAGQGFYDLSQVGSHPKVKFVGFCDVDTSRLGDALKAFPGVPTFQDYREMFAKLLPSIDGVLVSTPDHWHFNVALAALQAGKHVYCQKPLTHTVWEARQLRLTAEKQGVATQMGNQIHSHEAYRSGVRTLQSGAIGRVVAVHSWQSSVGNQFTKLAERPAGRQDVPPATLDWNIWLGPAPERDYVTGLYAHFNWRDWQDFGGGTLGDFGCHIFDPVFTALELTAPVSIIGDVDQAHVETWPTAQTVSYSFPGTKWTAKELPVTWYDGGRKPSRDLAGLPEGVSLPAGGSLLIGEAGTMVLPHFDMPAVYSKGVKRDDAVKKVEGGSHYHLWVDACLGNGKTTDGFSYAGPLTEAVNLGTIAGRVPGQKLLWDAANLRFTNSEAAQNLVSKTYRTGFQPTV